MVREKPHCGVSGVPFMKSTTGDEAMAREMALRVWVVRNRCGVRRKVALGEREGREMGDGTEMCGSVMRGGRSGRNRSERAGRCGVSPRTFSRSPTIFMASISFKWLICFR